MTAAGLQTLVLLQDKMFSCKYIPSQDFRHGHQAQLLHKVKNKPRICDFVKKTTRRKVKTHSFNSYLGDKAGFIWKTIFFCVAAATPAGERLTELQQLVVQQAVELRTSQGKHEDMKVSVAGKRASRDIGPVLPLVS